MAIQTTAGNKVKFLGLTPTLRANILKAILGDGSSVAVNSPGVCYVGLSSTDPATAVTEPTDDNYRRIKIGEKTGNTWHSDYLTVTGAQAVNSGIQKEIKFNRSLGAWTGSYPYFFLTSAATGSAGLMAWGELTEAITVEAKNVVPLFEEDKFRLYFPAPGEVETLTDNAAAADATSNS